MDLGPGPVVSDQPDVCKNIYLGSVFQYGYGLGLMNSLQVNLENIYTNSQDLPYGFTTGELYQLLDQGSMVHELGLRRLSARFNKG